LGAKTEVEITAKPYETILDRMAGIEGGSRAEYRRAHGIPDDSDSQHRTALADHPRELPTADPDAVLDAEIVTESDQQPRGCERCSGHYRQDDPVPSRTEGSWPRSCNSPICQSTNAGTRSLASPQPLARRSARPRWPRTGR
jgi:hypothetical protein